jgi:glutamyl-tRNA synthetase
MQITHVIRGDDHVNNTPRQLNVLAALGATPPQYAHLSMILGSDGKKLSKRRDSVSVMQYAEDGFLPDAVVNYLARLVWSHGDDEIFGREQLVEWFDLEHITPSAAQFDTEKLRWINQQYLKTTSPAQLVPLIAERLARHGIAPDATALAAAIALYADRCHTVNELAEALRPLYAPQAAPDLLAQHLSDAAKPALAEFAEGLNTVDWNALAISALLKTTLKAHGLKMPQLAMPLRVLLVGQTHTPSVDALIALLGRETVLQRLSAHA